MFLNYRLLGGSYAVEHNPDLCPNSFTREGIHFSLLESFLRMVLLLIVVVGVCLLLVALVNFLLKLTNAARVTVFPQVTLSDTILQPKVTPNLNADDYSVRVYPQYSTASAISTAPMLPTGPKK